MSQRSVPAPFLSKTYELVEDASTDDVVSWNESGRTFVVWKIDDFCKNLLPTYFNHNNFSSFVRQLNTYGFRKIVPDKWEFSNEKFKRGHKDLLTGICRRKSITTTSTYSPSIQDAGKFGNSDVVAAGSRTKSSFNSGEYLSTSTSSSREYSRNRPSSVETSKACKLEVINQELKRENEKLNYEVTKTKKQFQELIGFLSQHVKVDPKLLTGGTEDNGLVVDKERNEDNIDNNENEEYYCLKLFGVCLKQKNKNRS